MNEIESQFNENDTIDSFKSGNNLLQAYKKTLEDGVYIVKEIKKGRRMVKISKQQKKENMSVANEGHRYIEINGKRCYAIKVQHEEKEKPKVRRMIKR